LAHKLLNLFNKIVGNVCRVSTSWSKYQLNIFLVNTHQHRFYKLWPASTAFTVIGLCLTIRKPYKTYAGLVTAPMINL